MSSGNLKLPKGWEVRKLGEICKIELGRTPYRKDMLFWDSKKQTDNVWLSIADLKNTKDAFIYDSKEYISNKALPASKIVKKGTLLLSFKLTIGRLAFAGRDLFTNEAIASLPIKNEMTIDKFYLRYYFLFFNWDKALKGEVKVKGKTLNKAKLKELEIIIPPLPKQKHIVAILDKTFAEITKAETIAKTNLQNAKELFESYLNNIFTTKGDEWKEKTLGDKNLISIVDGDRGRNYPTKKDFISEDFCLFMSTKNVRLDGFKFEKTMFISKEKDELMGKGKLKRNDVVMTTRGTIGNIGIYRDDIKFENIRINSGMLIFRPNQKIISSEYLFRLFESIVIKKQIKESVTGAAQPQLPIKTLVNFILPFPKSLKTQQKIVKKLDQLQTEAKKLEVIYQKKIDDLVELKKSILQKSFNGEL